MSKHNYTQYSNKKRNTVHEVDNVPSYEHRSNNAFTETTTASNSDAPLEIKMECPKTEPEPETVFVTGTTITTTIPGTVTDCVKLNVRVAPFLTAEVACVLDANSEVEIDMTKSTDEWFKVTTASGVEGYCMRMFVNAKL